MEECKLYIIKRDGTSTEYDVNKLHQAILSAMVSVKIYDWEYLEEVVTEVESLMELSEQKQFTVETIEDLVCSVLSDNRYPSVLNSYVEYRDKRNIERKNQESIDNNIHKLINKDSRVVNENANKDSRVFNTQRDLTAGTVAKAVSIEKLLPKRVANAHLKGQIHFHDLDYSPYMPMTNCCLLDVETMLKTGFIVGNSHLSSPKSIEVAVSHIIQAIGATSSSQYGGISIHRIDRVLKPYAEMNYQKHIVTAKKYGIINAEEYAKELTSKNIYDSMQALEYEINSLTACTGQTPFVTVSFGRETDFIGREIQKSVLQVRMAKKSGKVAIFPKLTFFIEKGINFSKEDTNYDIKQLALKCASECMYPDCLFVDKLKELTGTVPTPMGCRSFLPYWENPETGLEELTGRMNLGVVTLNLPRIGIESGGDSVKFWRIFRERMNVTKEALMYRLERTKQALPENAPILYKEGGYKHRLKDVDSVDTLFKDGRATLSIGYIGIYETVASIYGLDWENNPEAKEFSIEIVKRMKKYADKWKEESGYWFSVYATPSESLTDRFNRIDTEKFGKIKGITDKDWYTNSFHYEIEKNPTPFEKLDFEKDYPVYASGGFIHYVEYPNIKQNIKALETVWDYAYDKVGYLGTNTPIDSCFECGYSGEFRATDKGYKCPTCGNNNPETCDVVKRLCGYLGNPLQRPVIHGRQEEIIHRVKHVDEMGKL